jgi:peptidoglycan endopeptidase LytF
VDALDTLQQGRKIMNRRDTIIVAALVNAGLLIVMFVSALKDHENESQIVSGTQASTLMNNERVAISEPKKIIGDEVDAALKQYMQQNPLQTPAAIAVSAPTPSFIEEVVALSTPIATQEVQVIEPASGVVEVKVKKGDVLEKLARQHHSSVSEIMKVNHLSSTQLKIGQVLKIPSGSAASAVKVENQVTETTSKFYTVKPGDSPWTIAVKNHMKVEELLKLNSMSEDKAKRLRPGDQIRIR